MARQNAKTEHHKHQVQRIQDTGEIKLHLMTDDEIEAVADAMEGLIVVINQQSKRVIAAYAGVEDLMIRIRQIKRSKT